MVNLTKYQISSRLYSAIVINMPICSFVPVKPGKKINCVASGKKHTLSGKSEIMEHAIHITLKVAHNIRRKGKLPISQVFWLEV